MDFSKYWKTIVDTLHDGLMVVDQEGKIRVVNSAVENLTGYSADELLGKSCTILNCTGCKIIGKGAGKDHCRLFSIGRMKDKKCLITKKDRHTTHILKSAAMLQDENGNIIGAIETLTDISGIIRKQNEILSLRKTFHLDDGYHGMLGKSDIMQNLFELIENVAHSDAPVMIQGPSGAGKELVARAIHEASPRNQMPFIKVNCAALNENLLESELFGHIRGAFTGADRDREGRFEAAHGGTIFLDEIGDVPLSTQVKLLRVLEEKKVERVGDNKPIPIDVRIVTATNKNLESLVSEGHFREDLFFRINVFPLYCPSLSERREDIPLIIQSFLRRIEPKYRKKILGCTPEAMERLTAYSWPGNIRELRNAIEYASVLCPGGAIDVNHLPVKIKQYNATSGKIIKRASDDAGERKSIVNALEHAEGNRSQAARSLGMSRVTLWKKIKKYGLKF
jgi:two-component system, NtrC family, response regulator HydG